MLMFIVLIYCMSSVVGTVSKALLKSTVARSIRCAGLGVFRLSRMCCVNAVRRVVVECMTLRSC